MIRELLIDQIKMEAMPISQRSVGWDSAEDREMFHWQLRLTFGRNTLVTEYSCGLAYGEANIHFFSALYASYSVGRPQSDVWKAFDDPYWRKPVKFGLTEADVNTLKRHGGFAGYLPRLYPEAKKRVAPFIRGVPPKLDYVVNSLVLDATCGEYTFDEWCSELGYDRDSRRAYAQWDSCRDMALKVRQLFGKHFDRIAAESRALDNHGRDRLDDVFEELNEGERQSMAMLGTEFAALHEKAQLEVERAARKVMDEHPILEEFVVAMGTWFFNWGKGEHHMHVETAHDGYGYVFKGEDPTPEEEELIGKLKAAQDAVLAFNEQYMHQFERMFGRTWSPARFVRGGPRITDW